MSCGIGQQWHAWPGVVTGRTWVVPTAASVTSCVGSAVVARRRGGMKAIPRPAARVAKVRSMREGYRYVVWWQFALKCTCGDGMVFSFAWWERGVVCYVPTTTTAPL